MTYPSPAELFNVEPGLLGALAAELSALAGELADDAALCRSTAGSFTTALGGADGWTAGSTAAAWAALEEQLADGATTLAGTLTAAAAAYTAHDSSLSRRIASTGPR